jgi:hypothetical protein
VATGVAAYQYKPLQNRRVARLLTLQPAPQSVPIVVSLTEACIGDDLDYEVISYTWGTEDEDDKRSSLILCNGGYIRVTVNCEWHCSGFARQVLTGPTASMPSTPIRRTSQSDGIKGCDAHRYYSRFIWKSRCHAVR